MTTRSVSEKWNHIPCSRCGSLMSNASLQASLRELFWLKKLMKSCYGKRCEALF